MKDGVVFIFIAMGETFGEKGTWANIESEALLRECDGIYCILW